MVNDNKFVVAGRCAVIDPEKIIDDRYAGLFEPGDAVIVGGVGGIIADEADAHTPAFGIDQGQGDVGMSERVIMRVDGIAGLVNTSDDDSGEVVSAACSLAPGL